MLGFSTSLSLSTRIFSEVFFCPNSKKRFPRACRRNHLVGTLQSSCRVECFTKILRPDTALLEGSSSPNPHKSHFLSLRKGTGSESLNCSQSILKSPIVNQSDSTPQNQHNCHLTGLKGLTVVWMGVQRPAPMQVAGFSDLFYGGGSFD